MLIYEKKVNTAGEGEPEVLVRKLYGTLANVPSADDEEITVTGGTFEIDDKGRVLIPKEADADEGDNEDEDPDAEEAEDEKEVVKLIYGNLKKVQFSASGIPDFDNDAEITVAISDKDGGEVTIIPNTDPDAKYQLTLEASPAEGGTVEGAGKYEEGEEVTISATANEGYAFVEWGDGDTNASRTYTMPGSASTLTATFEAVPEKVTITANVTPEGAGTVSGAGEVNKGSEVTLTATANDGYTFTKWDDDSTSATRTITPTADVTVTATFTANDQPGQ